MGAIISSKNDINPVLVNQTPRISTIIPTKQSDTNRSFLSSIPSIPAPTRPQQTTSFNSTAVSSQSPIINHSKNHPQTTSLLNNDHFHDEPSLYNSDFIGKQTFHSPVMNFVKTLPRIQGEATVIARKVINLNYQSGVNKHLPSSTRPTRTIVERNGKQFLTEMKERIERRYVQIYDENLGRMRLFEVTDYIPTRSVRPLTKQPSILPSVIANQSRSNLRDFQNLYEHDQQPITASDPYYDSSLARPPSSTSIPRFDTNHNRVSQRSSNPYDSTLLGRSSYKSNPYLPSSIDPTNHNRLSERSSEEIYEDYSANTTRNETTIDPFAKVTQIQPSRYTRRAQQTLPYAEPVAIGPRVYSGAEQDYAPFTTNNSRTEQYRPSTRAYYGSTNIYNPSKSVLI